MLKLSPSSLNLYLECPRCFWLRFNKKIYRPEGPVSTLPRGLDYTLKNYYDSFRKKGLPPELQGQVPGTLVKDEEKIKEMRKTNFGFQVSGEVWFGGALDEALELPNGSIVPLDNKSKGFPPKESHWTHRTQMSGYSLILREKGVKTENLAFLVYWFFNHKKMDSKNPLSFNVAVEEVKTNPDEIKEKILEAAAALGGAMPEPGQKSGLKSDELCSFCKSRELKENL